MPSEARDRNPDLERILKEVARQKGESFAAKLRPVIYRNLSRGRVSYFLENHAHATLQAYVQRVVETYESLHSTIELLQYERSPAAWEPLYEEFQKMAYTVLLKKGLIPGEATRRLAVDAATDAAAALLQAQFPYDTGFEPWAYNIIKFSCFKRIEREVRAAERIVEQNFQDGILHSEYDLEDSQGGWELHIDLYNACQQLANNRRQVLSLRYNHGLPFKEIARKMDKSVNAVHQLHHNAISQLASLLGSKTE